MNTTELADITFNACPKNLQELRNVVRSATASAGCSKREIQNLTLVLDEAITNVIRHGYDGDPSGKMRLRICVENRRLKFYLRDFAKTVDVSRIKPRDLTECRPGGLGINFIDSVMDDWRFAKPDTGAGNILIMTKHLGTQA